jgi:hypothetical protein
MLGCDLFNTSMLDYLLDNTGAVEVTGLGGRPKFVRMTNGTVLIPPSGDAPLTTLDLILSNPRNLSVRQELLGVPGGKNIGAEQTGAEGIELRIAGAAEGDEYALTLAMQSPDGLRDFPAYPLEIKCVSFDTALRDFSVDGATPPAFNPVNNAFTVNVPYTTTALTLGAETVHQGAQVELYPGTDDSGAVLAQGTHTVSLPASLRLGNNYFYLKVTAPSSSSQGYALTMYRGLNPDKAIRDFYFTLGVTPKEKYYGAGAGLPFEAGSGIIDEENHAITITVPYGTDPAALAALTPTVTHTGASIFPDETTPWGSAPNPHTYTVRAADGTTQDYTVNVAPGITISGITNVGLGTIITFSGVPSSPVVPGTSITVTISGGTVTAWAIDVGGDDETPSGPITNTVTFAAPMALGFYNINVLAVIDDVLYSGSFGIVVNN